MLTSVDAVRYPSCIHTCLVGHLQVLLVTRVSLKHSNDALIMMLCLYPWLLYIPGIPMDIVHTRYTHTLLEEVKM